MQTSFLLLVLAVIAKAHRHCRSGDWLGYGRKCFHIKFEPKTWDGARLYCESIGAQLASVHSDDENQFLISNSQGKTLWLGFRRKSIIDLFRWADGTAANYERWDHHAPQNSELCALVNSTGGWIDIPCGQPLPFVCEQIQVDNCTAYDVSHAAGDAWLQVLDDGRLKNCACSNPPPAGWSVELDCDFLCYSDDKLRRIGATYTRTINGVEADCICNNDGTEECSPISEDCTFVSAPHQPGEDWIVVLPGNIRVMECTCTDPPPPRWTFETNCVVVCYNNGKRLQIGEVYTRSINGVDENCVCTNDIIQECG